MLSNASICERDIHLACFPVNSMRMCIGWKEVREMVLLVSLWWLGCGLGSADIQKTGRQIQHSLSTPKPWDVKAPKEDLWKPVHPL
jgi:hypothetical protein